MADPATETTDPGNGKIFSSRNLVENIGQKSWQSEKIFEVADKRLIHLLITEIFLYYGAQKFLY